ncbi:MAG: hypothetical protein HY681_00210 [Chloroflexi bacterium]|nr:hypothetical protein [Chloroflexota bacterium]
MPTTCAKVSGVLAAVLAVYLAVVMWVYSRGAPLEGVEIMVLAWAFALGAAGVVLLVSMVRYDATERDRPLWTARAASLLLLVGGLAGVPAVFFIAPGIFVPALVYTLLGIVSLAGAVLANKVW